MLSNGRRESFVKWQWLMFCGQHALFGYDLRSDLGNNQGDWNGLGLDGQLDSIGPLHDQRRAGKQWADVERGEGVERGDCEMKITLSIFFSVVLTLALFGQSVTTYLNPVAPSACPPPITTAGVTTCPTNDPASPLYITPSGSNVYQPLVPTGTVTSVNNRTGAVKIPQAGATLQCTSITGTITIGAAGAVTISNAVGTGCNF